MAEPDLTLLKNWLAESQAKTAELEEDLCMLISCLISDGVTVEETEATLDILAAKYGPTVLRLNGEADRHDSPKQ